MGKRSIIVFLGLGVILLYPDNPVHAIEEKINDLSASVEVTSVFSLSMDNAHLSFGVISPGETKILGEGRFFNQVKCRSNSGQPWYLKAHLLYLKIADRNYKLPASYLKWKVADYKGSNQPEGGLNFQEFSQQPVLVYSSSADDNRGKEVVLRFQYSLTPPEDAPAGNYIGQVIFTITESP